MNPNEIPIYKPGDTFPKGKPQIIVSGSEDCLDIDFYHQIGVEDGYDPCVCVEDVDLFSTSPEEMSIDMYESWMSSHEFVVDTFSEEFFKTIIQRAIKFFRKQNMFVI